MGEEGAGKTTLAQQLARVFARAGLPCRHLHLYRWYQQLAWMPLLVLHNRLFGRRILVAERSLYDNIAVLMARRGGFREWQLGGLLGIFGAMQRFDFRLFLRIPSTEETFRRRPYTNREKHLRLQTVYRAIARRAGFEQFDSTPSTLAEVVGRLGDA